MPVIFRGKFSGFLCFSYAVETFFVAEAIVSAAEFNQFFGIFFIERASLALYVGTVGTADVGTLIMFKSCVFKSFVNKVNSAFNVSALIGILYS